MNSGASSAATHAGERLQTRIVSSSEVFSEEAVSTHGFAGHTINDYPEPARSYHLAYHRLEPLFQRTNVRPPLLVCRRLNVVGVMNSVAIGRIGIIPVRRIDDYLLEVEQMRVLFLTEALDQITFAIDEVLVTLPSWCK